MYLPLGATGSAPRPLPLSPLAADKFCTVFCSSIHSLSLGETTFSATSYTYTFPSLEPSAAFLEKRARSQASLLIALEETCVDTTGT